MKKTIRMLILTVLCACSVTAAAEAAGFTADGYGWTLEDGTLTISGEGPLYSSLGWLEHSLEIEHVVVEEGITALGTDLFQNCTQLRTVTLPESVQVLQNAVFDGCYDIEAIYYQGTERQWESVICTEFLTAEIIPLPNEDENDPNWAVSNIRWEGPLLTWEAPDQPGVTHYRVAGYRSGAREIMTETAETQTWLLPMTLGRYTDIEVETMRGGTVMAVTASEGLAAACTVQKADQALVHFFTVTPDTYEVYIEGLPANTVISLSFRGQKDSAETPVSCVWVSDANGRVEGLYLSAERLRPIMEDGYYILRTYPQIQESEDGKTISCRAVTCNGGWTRCELDSVYGPWIEASADCTGLFWLELGGQVYDMSYSSYALFTRVPTGSYDLHFKAPGCLTCTVTEIPAAGKDVWYSMGTITATAGDVDGNDLINARDINAFRREFGRSGDAIGNKAADINGDGNVNARDINVLRKNFGKSAAKDCTVQYQA